MAVKSSLRRLLEERLAELQALRGHHKPPQAEPTADDPRHFAVQGVLNANEKLVEEALRRLEAGLYGICAGCGGGIDQERLKALPEATLCIECAKKRRVLPRVRSR